MMKWVNLKYNKCPKCNKDLIRGMRKKIRNVPSFKLVNHDFSITTAPSTPTEILITHTCGFYIRESRYKEIVSGIVTAELEEKWHREDEQERDY